MTEGKWNCMWPMVLGRCVPKTGLTRVAWACTLLETEILGIYNPWRLCFPYSHSGEIWLTWVELSVRLINICPFSFSLIPAETILLNHPWVSCLLEPLLSTASWRFDDGVEWELLEKPVYNPEETFVLFYYLLMIFYELILIKPYRVNVNRLYRSPCGK